MGTDIKRHEFDGIARNNPLVAMQTVLNGQAEDMIKLHDP